MKIEEFIECTKDELLAAKRNSFSRSLVKQYSDLQFHEELMRLGRNGGTTGALASLLFVCKNLTIHALDEKESLIPFSFLDSVYGNAVFLLQYLKNKNVYALTIFRNEENTEELQTFFNHTYFSRSDAFKEDRNGAVFESLLDFGLVKCAMTMSKTYGIQDILEVAWQKFNERHVFTYHTDFSDTTTNYPAKAIRFIFNVEHPELSTMTLYADNDLNLFGKTKIIETGIDKIATALDFLAKCKYVQHIT